jgi:hypothetical protein
VSDSSDEKSGSEQRSKFEWGPDDIVILNPGDEGYDDEPEEDEVAQE